MSSNILAFYIFGLISFTVGYFSRTPDKPKLPERVVDTEPISTYMDVFDGMDKNQLYYECTIKDGKYIISEMVNCVKIMEYRVGVSRYKDNNIQALTTLRTRIIQQMLDEMGTLIQRNIDKKEPWMLEIMEKYK